jgi:hypothetical protein
MRVTATAAKGGAMAVVTLGMSLVGCESSPPTREPFDCKITRTEAQSVELIEEERVVRFTARVTDGDDNPIEGGEVHMALAYGRNKKEAGGPTTTGGHTNADGVVVADASVRNIKLVAQTVIFPEWVAQYQTPDDFEYCSSRGRGTVPEEVIQLVPSRG